MVVTPLVTFLYNTFIYLSKKILQLHDRPHDYVVAVVRSGMVAAAFAM